MATHNKKDFIDILAIDKNEIFKIIEAAKIIKANPRGYPILDNKLITAFFAYQSTRTRMSFYKAARLLGADINTINGNEVHLSRGESIGDVAKMFELYSDALVIRYENHKEIEEIGSLIEIPVINALTNHSHPCQALADIMTLIEIFKNIDGSIITWIGEDNNTFRSLAEVASYYNVSVNFCFEKRFLKDPKLINIGVNNIQVFENPEEACKDSIAIFADTWDSLGFAKKSKEDLAKLTKKYQVCPELFLLAQNDAVFLHCLPMHRGVEVSSDVVSSKACAVWQEADNRTYTQAAILAYCFNKLDLIS